MPSFSSLFLFTASFTLSLASFAPFSISSSLTPNFNFLLSHLNKHLNNTKYLDYILDLNPSIFHQEHNYKKVNMVFHQEVKEDDLLEIWGSKDNTYYQFKLDGNKVFECNIEY